MDDELTLKIDMKPIKAEIEQYIKRELKKYIKENYLGMGDVEISLPDVKFHDLEDMGSRVEKLEDWKKDIEQEWVKLGNKK